MFFVNFEEIWDWDRHLIWTIYQIHFFQGLLSRNTFSLLVIANCIFCWVVNRVEFLFISFVDEFFLLDLDLEGFTDFIFDCNLLHKQRGNEMFNCILLYIVDSDPHVCASLNLVLFKMSVCIELVCRNRPMIK